MVVGSYVPFLVVLYLQYCTLEDSPTKCEMHDIYIYVCVKGICGKTLVGRNHIGTEILMSVSITINEKAQFWKMSQSENFSVLCAL